MPALLLLVLLTLVLHRLLLELPTPPLQGLLRGGGWGWLLLLLGLWLFSGPPRRP
ncbi:MAG: hypothetical protein VKJ44_04515 [Synechococcus sp.]|nr:hypothetical protein [Synechococcus sp.]